MRVDVAGVLIELGFKTPEDFVAVQSTPEKVEVTWFSAQPMPSKAEINAFDMSPSTVTAREDAKEPLFADLKTQAQGAVDDNNTFLALATPTNAQTLAQIKKLTQQNTKIIKAMRRVIERVWR